MTVSIIIPVYNALSTLPSCLASLKNQMTKDVEIIFVDDCSKDDSNGLLSSFANDNPDITIRIIRHAENRGVASARNTGLDAATGDYIYFLDADDMLEPNAIERMLSKAESESLDIVGCEWYLSFEKNERKMVQPDFATPKEAIRQMMLGKMRWNLWLFMVRRSLYEDIRFIPGQDMGEDMLVINKLFLEADKVGILHEHLYHYSQPTLSKTFSDKLINQVSANVSALETALQKSDYADDLLPILPQLKLNIKLPLLIGHDRRQYQKWLDWWPEANNHVMENPILPFRTKLLQWCASKRLWFCVKAYYYFVIKFLYGVIYH